MVLVNYEVFSRLLCQGLHFYCRERNVQINSPELALAPSRSRKDGSQSRALNWDCVNEHVTAWPSEFVPYYQRGQASSVRVLVYSIPRIGTQGSDKFD